MSVEVWIAIGVVGWLVLAVVAGCVAGPVIKHGTDTDPREVEVFATLDPADFTPPVTQRVRSGS